MFFLQWWEYYLYVVLGVFRELNIVDDSKRDGMCAYKSALSLTSKKGNVVFGGFPEINFWYVQASHFICMRDFDMLSINEQWLSLDRTWGNHSRASPFQSLRRIVYIAPTFYKNTRTILRTPLFKRLLPGYKTLNSHSQNQRFRS